MKSWKEYPNLFANGKFKVNINGGSRISDNNPYLLDMISTDRVYIWNTAICERIEYRFDYCTLIARKIEDMTDEETNFVNESNYDALSCDAIRTAWIKRGYDMRGNTLINLLSIGVYPFDQSHFGKDVIDIKTL